MARASRWHRVHSDGNVYSKDGRWGIEKRTLIFPREGGTGRAKPRGVEYVLVRFASFDAPAPPEEIAVFESVKSAKEFLENKEASNE